MSIDDRYSESWRASIDRRIAQLLEPGILTREEMRGLTIIDEQTPWSKTTACATPEQIAAFMRSMKPDAAPDGKPWINPTPWKRGRKAQRMRA